MSEEAAPRLPRVGTKIAERYRLERRIAAGGMGVVYEALDLATAERARVAVKILRPETLDVHDVVDRFQREAGLAQRIDHPNVVRVLDAGATDEGLPFMVMELLRGRDVSEELKRVGPFPIDLAVHVVRQAARGVAAAHALRIIHRDLKPSNLFLVSDAPSGEPDLAAPIVKVLDFGVSKALDTEVHVTATNLAVGTPLYMSPEQVRSAKTCDARTDVWALGVILFQLLTRRTPFEGETAPAVAAAIVADDPLPLADLRPDAPRELVAIVGHLLQKSASKRAASAEEVLERLAPFDGIERAADSTAVFEAMPRRWRQTVKMERVDVARFAPTHAQVAPPAPPAPPPSSPEGGVDPRGVQPHLARSGPSFPAYAVAPAAPPSHATTPGWTHGQAALVPSAPRRSAPLMVLGASIFVGVTAVGTMLIVKSSGSAPAPTGTASSIATTTAASPSTPEPSGAPMIQAAPDATVAPTAPASVSASSAPEPPPSTALASSSPPPSATATATSPAFTVPNKTCAKERKILVKGRLVCP